MWSDFPMCMNTGASRWGRASGWPPPAGSMARRAYPCTSMVSCGASSGIASATGGLASTCARTGSRPGPWLGALKRHIQAGRAEEILDLPGGRRSRVWELAADLMLVRPGRRLVYATDLADTPENRARLVRLAGGAHTLFCEAAFAEADREEARRTGHLTARACGRIAKAAPVARLVPFHFSRRYERDPWRV